MSLTSRVTSPSFDKPREPTTSVLRTTGRQRPHHAQQPHMCESWGCTSNLSESSHCTPTFCLIPPEDDRHPQDPSSRGATQVALGSSRHSSRSRRRQGCEVVEMVESTCAF